MGLEAFDDFESFFVSQLVLAVFFGGERPEVVGAADFFFVNEVVVDEILIDIGNSDFVGVKQSKLRYFENYNNTD